MDLGVIEKALKNLITEADVIHGQIMGSKHGYKEEEKPEEGEQEEGEEVVEEAMEEQEPTETPEQEAAETPEEQAVEAEEGIEAHKYVRKPSAKLAAIFAKKEQV